MMHRRLFAIVIIVGLGTLARGQDRVTGANYPLAQKFNREFVSQHVQEASVSPQWIGKTDVFWYSSRTATGMKYWKVDAAKKEKSPLFDHVVLAAALSEATHKPLDAETLRLDRLTVSNDSKKLTLVAEGTRYEFDLAAGKLKSLGKAPPPGGPMSPQQIARLRQQLGDERVNEMLRRLQDDEQDQKKDGTGGKGQGKQPTKGGGRRLVQGALSGQETLRLRLQVQPLPGEEGQPEDKAMQLTKDGEEKHSFAGGGGGFGGLGKGKGQGNAMGSPPSPDRKSRANVTWSKDSYSFYVTRTDSRGVKDLYLVDSIANPAAQA